MSVRDKLEANFEELMIWLLQRTTASRGAPTVVVSEFRSLLEETNSLYPSYIYLLEGDTICMLCDSHIDDLGKETATVPRIDGALALTAPHQCTSLNDLREYCNEVVYRGGICQSLLVNIEGSEEKNRVSAVTSLKKRRESLDKLHRG